MTFWEFLTLVLSLEVWGDSYATSSILTIVGDNTGSLQDALSLKGMGALNTLAMELSWRKARHRWHFQVGHLPTEANGVADALSRLSEGYELPPKLRMAKSLDAPSMHGFFRTLANLPPLASED